MAETKKAGKLIDQLYKLKQQIDTENVNVKKAEEKVKKIKAKYEAKEKEIFDSFDKQELEGAFGTLAKVTINRMTIASVKDWEKLWPFIVKTKAYDLVQRRINNTAYRDRLEAGVQVPGVEKFVKVSLSLRKK